MLDFEKDRELGLLEGSAGSPEEQAILSVPAISRRPKVPPVAMSAYHTVTGHLCSSLYISKSESRRLGEVSTNGVVCACFIQREAVSGVSIIQHLSAGRPLTSLSLSFCRTRNEAEEASIGSLRNI